MNKVMHHPEADLLLACATGALDPAVSIAVESHAALCDACRAELQTYEAIGGALMEATPPVALSDGFADRMLAMIDGPALDVPAGIDFQTDPVIGRLPQPVRDLATAALGKRGWQRVGAGLATLDLAGPSDDTTAPEVQLLRLEPGVATPRHTHRGLEFTVVLTGAFRDEVARYGAGDFAMGSPDLTHRPVAEEGEVCLALSVTTAPVQLTGVRGLVQRALGH